MLLRFRELEAIPLFVVAGQAQLPAFEVHNQAMADCGRGADCPMNIVTGGAFDVFREAFAGTRVLRRLVESILQAVACPLSIPVE